MSTQSNAGIKLKSFVYEDFQGLDTSRDVTSLDTGSQQHLAALVNATCDWRGQIVRDATATHREGINRVDHVRYFTRTQALYAENNGTNIDLVSERGHKLSNSAFAFTYPTNANLSSTVFNRTVFVAARALPVHKYDGVNFGVTSSKALDELRPAYLTSVQRRLVVSGIPGKETQIHLSRVDNENIFSDDEDPASTNVLRGGFVDVANLLGTADEITGLGVFEQNRLVVFTADRAIIFRIDPNIDNWILDDNSFINIGCTSHNSIVNAGTDLLFCSRSGIHSIKRSEDNGILVYSYSLSDKIDLLYRELFDSVEDKESISSVFDQDQAHYHIFFPQPGGVKCRRLTLAMNPESGEAAPKFSTGEFLNARSGDFLAGRLIFGTSGGIHNVNNIESTDGIAPNVVIRTPLLWHGSLTDTKETHSVVIQAAGVGNVTMRGIDEVGNVLGTLVFEVDDTDDNNFSDVPLSTQYERKWSHRYRAARYEFTTEGGGGILRIIGFAVNVRT